MKITPSSSWVNPTPTPWPNNLNGATFGGRIDLSQGPIKSVEFRDGVDAFDVRRWNTYEIIFDVTPVFEKG